MIGFTTQSMGLSRGIHSTVHTEDMNGIEETQGRIIRGCEKLHIDGSFSPGNAGGAGHQDENIPV